jgi:hypothetical protein
MTEKQIPHPPSAPSHHGLAPTSPARGCGDLPSPVHDTGPKGLLDLPLELVLQIAELVPPVSVACFALCNRQLRRGLKRRARAFFRAANHNERIEYLTLLARDLPARFVCHTCFRLHRRSDVQLPGSTSRHRSRRCIYEAPSLRPGATFKFKVKFAHVHLIMKRHYHGAAHGLPLETLRHVEIDKGVNWGVTRLLSVDATIDSNELLLRSQQWILLRRSQRQEFARYEIFEALCYHVETGQLDRFRMRDFVSTRLERLDSGERSEVEVLQCQECDMDYTVDAVLFGKSRIAMLVTRWFNLGAGVDPLDEKWLCHHTHLSDRTPHDVGTIRARFESHGERSVQKLTAENIALLSSHHKRRMGPLFSAFTSLPRVHGVSPHLGL